MENYFVVHLTEPLPVNLLPLILNIPLSCLLSPMFEHDLGFHAIQHAKADSVQHAAVTDSVGFCMCAFSPFLSPLFIFPAGLVTDGHFIHVHHTHTHSQSRGGHWNWCTV